MSHHVDECYAVYDETVRRARKPHICVACKETIARGHRYVSVRIVFEGSARTIKRCARCQKLHEHLRPLGDGDTWPAEALDCGRSYQSEWDMDPPDDIAALAFAMQGELEP